MKISFTIPGEPTGKGRPRVYKTNGFSRTVTPEKTVRYENLIKILYPNESMLQGEIKATITAYYAIPKSINKKNRLLIDNGKLHPTKKPDLDNIAKIILDALNGIAYKDDSQVVRLIVEKHYSTEPRVEVLLSEAGEN